jgi:flagellar biosynthesis chaperone FliJ
MSDQLEHLNRQIASLESSIAQKIAGLKAARERWDDWKAIAYFVQRNT